MYPILEILFLVLLIVLAMIVARVKDLLSATIILSGYSLIMSILWVLLSAPDIAITEAAIGAGITTILFIIAINKTRRME